MIYTTLTHNDSHELENPKRSQLLPLVSPWQADGWRHWRGSDGLTFSPLSLLHSLPPSLHPPRYRPSDRKPAGSQAGALAPSPAVPNRIPLAASFPLSPPSPFSWPALYGPFSPSFPRQPPLEPSLPLSGSRFAGGARHATRSTPTRRLRTRNKRRHRDEVKMPHTSFPLWFFPSFIYFAPHVILGSLVF